MVNIAVPNVFDLMTLGLAELAGKVVSPDRPMAMGLAKDGPRKVVAPGVVVLVPREPVVLPTPLLPRKLLLLPLVPLLLPRKLLLLPLLLLPLLPKLLLLPVLLPKLL